MSELPPDDAGAKPKSSDDWIVLLIVAVLIGLFLFIFLTVG